MNSTRSRQPTPPAVASISRPGRGRARRRARPGRAAERLARVGGGQWRPRRPGVVVLAVDAVSEPPPLHAVSTSEGERPRARVPVAATAPRSRRVDGPVPTNCLRAHGRYDRRHMATLAERLGYAPDAKLLIVNCDDLGLTHSANVAGYEALRARRRHERVADGAVPVGTRRRPPATAARTSACTSRSTPSSTPTGGARSRTPRACSTATAGSRARSRTRGTTPTSTRCDGSAARRSSGPSSGAST